MEKTEKFRMRRYSKKTTTNIYAAPMRGVNDLKYLYTVKIQTIRTSEIIDVVALKFESEFTTK